MGLKPRQATKSTKPLTIGRRVQLLVSDELNALLKGAGFRKSDLTFRRQVGAVTQVIRFAAGASSWGGKTPPKGNCQVLIGCGVTEFLGHVPAPREYDCHLRFEITSVVPKAERSWVVPMTRGPYRMKLGEQLQRDLRSLLAVLETLRDRVALAGAAEKYSRVSSKAGTPISWIPPVEAPETSLTLFDATSNVLVACADVLCAPKTILKDVRYYRGCIELNAIVDGQSVACKGSPSAIHSLAAHLWEVVTPEMIWKTQMHPKAHYPVNPIEHSLFVGALETPMRELAGVLAAEGHREEARRCLLRVIFPEDALDDPLGRQIFDSDPVRGMAGSGASGAGWLRKCLPFLSAETPTQRLAAAKTVAMTLGDVLEDTSGKRLRDIVSDCRAANALCLKDKTPAVRDLGRLIENRLDAHGNNLG